jgi:hypothetical protein
MNPLISLEGKPVQLGASVRQGANALTAFDNVVENRQTQPMRMRQMEATATGTEQDVQMKESILKLRDSAMAAQPVLERLKAGDIQGAANAMRQRGAQRQSQGGDGSTAMQGAEDLMSGDPARIQGVSDSLAGLMRQAQQFGAMETPAAPQGYSNPSTDAQGRRWGTSPTTGNYEQIPGTEGVSFAKPAPVTNTNINVEAAGAGLTEEQKQLAKLRVGYFGKLQDAANNSFDQNSTLDQLSNIDVSTGWGSETKANLAGVANSIFGAGTGDDLLNTNATAMQSFRALSKKMQAAELNKAKGPQTEGDAKRIADTLAGMQNEKNANTFLINSLRATNNRQIEQYEFYQSVLQETGSLESAESKWVGYKRKTPMVSDSVRDKETGLPMFFDSFRQKVLERNPSATREQVINAWRELQ